MPISVAIAEPHDVTRWGVRSAVERFGGSVVATAETGLDALSMVETHKPTVLTLCLGLPHVSGLDILKHLQKRTVAVEVVVLTTQVEERYVRASFERGASAYVRKQDSLAELDQALQAAVEGEYYLSNALPEDWMSAAGTGVSESEVQYRTLTMRQREVMQLTAEGYTSEEVGDKLGLSPRTIERHRQCIREKLGLRNVTEMTRYAVHMGLYSTPGSDWLNQTEAE